MNFRQAKQNQEPQLQAQRSSDHRRKSAVNLGAAQFPQGRFTPPEDVKQKGPRNFDDTSVAQETVEFIPFLSHFCRNFVPFCPAIFPPLSSFAASFGRTVSLFRLLRRPLSPIRGPGEAQRSEFAGERRRKGAH